MTPEEALKAIKTLVDAVPPTASERSLRLTLASVQTAANKGLDKVPRAQVRLGS